MRDLAESLTAGAPTPYDKALAVESHLKTLPYSFEIDPPPYDADGVDHFLFDQGTGYSEYFSSAMVVMLRTVGVPAKSGGGLHHGRPGRGAASVHYQGQPQSRLGGGLLPGL